MLTRLPRASIVAAKRLVVSNTLVVIWPSGFVTRIWFHDASYAIAGAIPQRVNLGDQTVSKVKYAGADLAQWIGGSDQVARTHHMHSLCARPADRSWRPHGYCCHKARS